MWKFIAPTFVECLRNMEDIHECIQGDYPFTLASLELINVLVDRSIMSPALPTAGAVVASPLLLKELCPIIMHFKGLFACFDGWKYNRISERWLLGTKV